MFVGSFYRRLLEVKCQPRHTPFQQLKNQRGSAAVDYAVILVFIVLVVVVVVVTLQDRSEAIFNATATVVGNFGSME